MRCSEIEPGLIFEYRSSCNQLRCVMLLVIFAVIGTLPDNSYGAAPGSWQGQSITEFNAKQNRAFSWQIVNDGVMGGRSRGNLEFTPDETMHFWGTLSLENNGGFSTARSGTVTFDLSNDLGLLLLVKGDGRTYEARLESTAKYRNNRLSFTGKFETKAGEWTQVKVPFDEFVGTWRGRQFPEAQLDTGKISRVWILLADKKPGPFDLEIKWIRTYGKGKGKPAATDTSSDTTNVLPVENQKLQQIIPSLDADGRFKTLRRALDTAALTTFFQWDNPLTVFATTDQAFAELPDGLLEELLQPNMREKLTELLSYHVVPGAVDTAKAIKSKRLKTVQRSQLDVRKDSGQIFVNDAKILPPTIECTDGIVHVIDTVLIPPAPR